MLKALTNIKPKDNVAKKQVKRQKVPTDPNMPKYANYLFKIEFANITLIGQTIKERVFNIFFGKNAHAQSNKSQDESD